jgi:outer membrane protein assembly factor BamB
LDAENGKEIWRKRNPDERVRESMGLSADSSLVYAKTMEGKLIGVSSSLPDMQITWHSDIGLNYEIAPTAIVEYKNIIYVPSNSGMVVAVNRNGTVLWKHKISNCLITCIVPVSKNKVIATTMDGKVAVLKF